MSNLERKMFPPKTEELLQEEQMGGPINCSDSELCTFLLALGEGYLPIYYSDTSQSVQLKSISIASKSWRHGKKPGAFPGFQSLQMSRNLTDDRGEAVLTWFLAGFPVPTFHSQEEAPELTEHNQDCGQKWPESLARFDPASRLWKTAQRSLLGDSEECSVIWPRSGMTAAGRCWELPMLGRRTNGTDSGLWPTPTVCGNHNRKDASATSGDGLATAVKKWPTPTSHNAKETSAAREHLRNAPSLTAQCGGPLNPIWVEKLMGWPERWTDLTAIPQEVRPIVNAWESGWESGVDRVAPGQIARAHRLKAIGNGQVPQCAAMAWKILTEDVI